MVNRLCPTTFVETTKPISVEVNRSVCAIPYQSFHTNTASKPFFALCILIGLVLPTITLAVIFIGFADTGNKLIFS